MKDVLVRVVVVFQLEQISFLTCILYFYIVCFLVIRTNIYVELF